MINNKFIASFIFIALLAGCSGGQSLNSSTSILSSVPEISSTTTSSNTIFSTDSIRIDGPKFTELSFPELKTQAINCKPDISEFALELTGSSAEWNFDTIYERPYDDGIYDSEQQAWDLNAILAFDYVFSGPYKKDYRERISIRFSAWKPVSGISRLSEVEHIEIGVKQEAERVFQLSPENNFAVTVLYKPDIGSDTLGSESIPLEKIDLIETFVKQLIACDIPYWLEDPSKFDSDSQASTTTIVDSGSKTASWADSLRIDGPKIEEFYRELEQQVSVCNPNISDLALELNVEQLGWSFDKIDANIYDERSYESAQHAWDANEILYFSYYFLGPSIGDYRQQIQVEIGAWKPVGEISRLNHIKEHADRYRESDYVVQLSPKNNFAITVVYRTDQWEYTTGPTSLGDVGPVEAFVKQLVACGIPYWISS
jgi:hypothetical protein